MAKSNRELAQDAVNFFLSRKEGVGDRTSQAFNLQNQLLGNDIFQQQQFRPALGEIFDYNTRGFTEDFLEADPKGGYFSFGESQADKIQKTLDLLDEYKDQGTIPLELRQILERAKQRAEQGEQISYNLFNTPYFQRQRQRGIVDLPEFQLANLNFGQPTYTDTGIVSVFPRQVSTPDLATQIRQEQAAASQRAQNASQAQESRNQSRDDYTGGGGTVVIGKGGGQTKTVSPRSREAMYSAPTRRSSPPPFSRFNNGGIVGLFRRF